MEQAEYSTLQDYERWYWWYRAQRAALLDVMRSLQLPAGARLLDVGCGTGSCLRMLSEEMELQDFGFDYSPHAAELWSREECGRRSLGSANEIPFANNTFDAVITVDVIYCYEVDPPTAAAEIARVLKPGGKAVVIVPAYQWLRSTHDDAVHGGHRFTRSRLRQLLEFAGLTVTRTTHLSTALFPAIAAVRLLRRLQRVEANGNGNGNGHAPPPSDLRPLPGWVNRGLLGVALTENLVARYIDLPFGSSVLGIAEKPAN